MYVPQSKYTQIQQHPTHCTENIKFHNTIKVVNLVL